MFDLLSTVEYGGCSAKLSPKELDKVLQQLKVPLHENLLVGTETHDDAAVYKINEEQAIIFTTDFFPPICSDPYNFGKIAAANALSDVYAMGGEVLIALNLIMFPSEKIPVSVLTEILKGGESKVTEANALIVGGHTIDDYPPKYGLAVLGITHPEKIITNSKAVTGNVLIITKPLGSGTIIAGKRLELTKESDYVNTLEMMMQLNKNAAKIMNKYNVKCATDITGFGLLGHLVKMAKASSACLEINVENVPFLPGALELVELGCIPGAAFRNQNFVEESIVDLSYEHYERKMLLFDAQTSGGIVMCVEESVADVVLTELRIEYPHSEIIGKVTDYKDNYIKLI